MKKYSGFSDIARAAAVAAVFVTAVSSAYAREMTEEDYLREKWRTRPANLSTGMNSAQLLEALPPLVAEWRKTNSWQIVKAHAFRYLCERSSIDVSEMDWFPAFADWTWAPQSGSHTRTRGRGHPVWKMMECRNGEVLSAIGSDYHCLKRRGSGGRWMSYHDFDHSAPDWENVIPLGFTGLSERLAANSRDDDYYRARRIAADGVAKILRRFTDLAGKRVGEITASMRPDRAKRLRLQAESLRRLSSSPPQTAYDVLNFIYLFWCLSEQFEALQVRTLGNLDRIVAPYYFADLAAGRTTEVEFREQLRHFWWQWGSIDNFYGQPVYFGGTKSDGTSEYTDVSRIMLEVHDELALPTPKLHLKMGPSTPEWVWRKTLDMARRQRSVTFIGEEPHMRVITSMGYTPEQARTFMIWGCYEWAVRDSANDIFGAAINLVKPVEEILRDAAAGRFRADDFASFKDEYFRRTGKMVKEAIDCVLAGEKKRGDMNPSLLFSIATPYSVMNGIDAITDGTAHGNNTGLWMVGLGSAVDSLAAVEEIVFARREMTLGALGALMAGNWKGRDDLRFGMMRSKRKWGNNDPWANALALEITKKVFSPVNGLPNGRRNGRFKACGHVSGYFIALGRHTGATPDGRLKGEELSKNVSPSMGADTEGASALVVSAGTLSALDMPGDFPLDVALLPGTVAGNKGLSLMRAIVETFFKNGGLVIQFNVHDPSTLRDAQRNPRKYENLQVRVCGWNVRWNDLPKVQQDAYIRRAESIGK